MNNKYEQEYINKIGDKINKNWIAFLRENKEYLEKEISELPKYEEDEELPYMYIEIAKDSCYPSFAGIMDSQYYGGYSRKDNWCVNIMVNNQTTLDELKDIDLSEESNYYDDMPEKKLTHLLSIGLITLYCEPKTLEIIGEIVLLLEKHKERKHIDFYVLTTEE